jgi:sec-independent protein translocase protein TatB
MFGIDFSEILVIFAIALVVLGPEKLPRLAASIGRWVGRARAMARQFREQLEQEAETIKRNVDLRAQQASAPPPAPAPPAATAPPPAAASPGEPPPAAAAPVAESVDVPPSAATAAPAAAATAPPVTDFVGVPPIPEHPAAPVEVRERGY